MKHVFVFLVVVSVTVAAGPTAEPHALPILENPWLAEDALFIVHQGGEAEFPSATMFAFKESLRIADESGLRDRFMLELDLHRSADGHFMVLHDETVDRTTNGAGRVDQMTKDEVQALDAAYWYCQGEGARHDESKCDGGYPYRGIRTGDAAPPSGYSADDFRVPTLAEIFAAFPDDPINIEIKQTAPDTVPYEHELAAFIRDHGRQDDVLVGSFLDHSTEAFKAHAPEMGTYYATGEAASFWATSQGPAPGSPNRHYALAVPMTFEGIPVMSADFVADAHANNIAVNVWTIGDRATMESLLCWGVDGIMTDRPGVLAQVYVDFDAGNVACTD